MKILFFGDGEWGTRSFARLLRESQQIVGLVVRAKPTDPDIIRLAEDNGLPVFNPDSVNSPQFIATVKKLNPDLNLSVSYDQIFKEEIIQITRLGLVNFHAGKLPFYRGRNVINWALINGEEEIGITAHYVNGGIDTGDIILQRILPIFWEDTYGDVLKRVVKAFPELVNDTVDLIANGRVKRKSQKDLPGTYFAARGEGDEWIEWQDSSRNIYNKVRAISHPGPGARTIFNQRIVKIWKAVYNPGWPEYMATPGQIVGRIDGRGVMVKTGDSVLELTSVETDEKGVFVPGWPVGTRLGLKPATDLKSLITRVEKLERGLKEIRKKSGL